MLRRIDLRRVLYLDIETVSGKRTYAELSESMQSLWKHKCKSILKQYDEPVSVEQASETYTEKAGIYAEFGKIVCISVGIVTGDPNTGWSVRLKSFADHDERILLESFAKMVTKHYGSIEKDYFCGHNIKEFDVPYLCRRLMVNQVPLPPSLDLTGRKPWETKHLLDTMELWKFGDYKAYTSLKLLAGIFGFPSPKDDIDGSEVGRVYWEEDDLQRIATYCEKDVLAVVQLIQKYRRQELIPEDQVVVV